LFESTNQLIFTLTELMTHFKATIALATAVTVTVPVAWQEHAIARIRMENQNQAAALEQLRSTPDAGTAQAQADWETQRSLKERADLERLRKQVPPIRAGVNRQNAFVLNFLY
jgi:hypothetical protein